MAVTIRFLCLFLGLSGCLAFLPATQIDVSDLQAAAEDAQKVPRN